MKPLLVLPLLCALLAPVALSAADFEGSVTMKMSGREASGKGADATMNLSLKNGLTRMDMGMQGQNASIIMDPAKQEMTVLLTQQRMYMVQPIPTTPPAEAAKGTPAGKTGEPALEKTGITEKILGYDCEKYVVNDKGKTTEIWLTDQLGAFMGSFGTGGPAGRGGPAPATQGWENLLQGKKLFPMRVITTEGGKEVGRMEVTAVDKKSLPDTLFTVPAGWQNLGAMRGMGGRPPGGG